MFGLFRMGKKARALDSSYFNGTSTERHSFRGDLRAVIGGALAFAFFAAAVTGSVEQTLLFSDATWTAIAGLAGGIAGKFML